MTTYDVEQLMPAAKGMIHKLEKYLHMALQKPVYLHAVILDPRTKMVFFKGHKEFLAQYGLTITGIKTKFKAAATSYDAHSNHSIELSDTEEGFDDLIYGKRQKLSDLDEEIAKYLAEGVQDKKACPLQYWARRNVDFPSLAKMAKAILAIPATSAPSERAFSSGSCIVSDNRASLGQDSIEILMCLKNWYKKLGKVIA
jgi:hypothetical protein